MTKRNKGATLTQWVTGTVPPPNADPRVQKMLAMGPLENQKLDLQNP